MSTSPYPCCEGNDCLIASDDFNRSNNTDLGCHWYESGDMEIFSSQLKANGVSRAVTVAEHRIETSTGYASAELHDLSAGRIYRVFINADEEGQAYEYAELEITSDSSFLRVGVHPGTAADAIELGPIDNVSVDGIVKLELCRNLTGLYAEAGISAVPFECIGSGVANRGHAGVAAMASGTHLFDNFTFAKHGAVEDGCTECSCTCEHFCVPKTLTLTISASGDCSCLDDEEITLTFVPHDVVPCVWFGEADLCDWKTGTGTETWAFTLRYDGGCGEALGQDGFILCAESGSIDVGWESGLCPGCSGGCPGKRNTECSCSPLSLSFGPFSDSQSGSPPLECSFSIVITE